jgi:hypothetical protein
VVIVELTTQDFTARLQLLVSTSLERFVQNNINVLFFVND